MNRISTRILQSRGTELGRIRLGDKGGKGQPVKLSTFRFTSAHERHIRDLSQLYGGQAERWDNGGRPQWQVTSESSAIPVVVVPSSVSQYMELWSGGGCQRRCDGETELISQDSCHCEAEGKDLADRPCRPTTRLSVMLPELEAVGLWRVESHGWNSAAELPAIADLAGHVGTLVKATLLLDQRMSVRDGKTRQFVVPVLDLAINPHQLADIVSGETPPAVAAPPSRPAIAAEPHTTASDPLPATQIWEELIAGATTSEECRIIYRQAADAKAPPPILSAITAKGRRLASQEREAAASQEGTEGPGSLAPPEGPGSLDATSQTLDPSPSADAAWERLIRIGGQADLDLVEIDALVLKVTGVKSDDADASQMDAVALAIVRGDHRA